MHWTRILVLRWSWPAWNRACQVVGFSIVVNIIFDQNVSHHCTMYIYVHVQCTTGKHKMLSKLATQSFNILRLIARNPNFLRPKVPYFNVSRLSRLKMTQNGPKWLKVAQIWPKMAQNGPRMTQNDPKWPKNDPKWPTITPNGPKMTPGFTHFFRKFCLLKKRFRKLFRF